MKTGFVVLALAAFVAPVAYAGQPEGAPGAAEADGLTALGGIAPGQWTLRSRGRASDSRSLCVADVRALLQVRHGAVSCSRFVIANGPRLATVHYTCPGSGHGRTTIRVESAQLVQIETQGIASNAPFEANWEGRRTGECHAKTTPAR